MLCVCVLLRLCGYNCVECRRGRAVIIASSVAFRGLFEDYFDEDDDCV